MSPARDAAGALVTGGCEESHTASCGTVLALVDYLGFDALLLRGEPTQAFAESLMHGRLIDTVEGIERRRYFLTAIYNNTLKAITRNRLDSLPEEPYEDETAPNPAEEVERADTRRAVREAIQRLPKRQREVMELNLRNTLTRKRLKN
jgi:hypothetical protein